MLQKLDMAKVPVLTVSMKRVSGIFLFDGENELLQSLASTPSWKKENTACNLMKEVLSRLTTAKQKKADSNDVMSLKKVHLQLRRFIWLLMHNNGYNTR